MRRLIGYSVALLTLVLTTVALIGCGGGGGGPSGGSSSPDIAVSSTQLDFGGVVANKFTERTITIRNTGTAGLNIDQIGGLAAPFSLGFDQCSNSSVSPSESCNVNVRFAPTALGNFSGNLTIPSNDDEGPVIVALSGTATALNLSINRVITNCGADTIRLFVAVTDGDGNLPSSLTPDQFRVFEDGASKAIVEVIVPPADPADNGQLSASLVLDYSASTIPVTVTLEAAAAAFVAKLDFLGPDVDEAEIIKFAQQVSLMQGYTSIQSALTDAINAAFPFTRLGTSLFDAIKQAVDDTANRANLRRAVIVVSDGNDDSSTLITNVNDMIAYAVQSGIPLFTIGIGDTSAGEVNIGNLQRLADETGGQFFLAPDAASVEDIYDQIFILLSNNYIITYTTTSTAGGTISIDVELFDTAVPPALQGQDSKDATGC